MSEDQLHHRESPNLAKSMKRSNKPLMEKRRRERINSSLEELKTLVLEALNRDTSQYSKLEKADILEMTVKHLRSVQRQQLTLAAAADSSVVGKYRAGFSECAMEVTRYLGRVDGVNPDTRGRLVQHLGSCVQRMQNVAFPLPNQGEVSPALHPGSAQAYAQGYHPQALSLQMPTATPQSTLPGATQALSPQQAQLLGSGMASVNGVPVIPAFNLSQLQVVGGLVIPTGTNAVAFQQQQQQQQQQPRNINNTSCQYRDMNNNDVATPSLMPKQPQYHSTHAQDRVRADSRDSRYSCSDSSVSSQSAPPVSPRDFSPAPQLKKALPVVPEPIKLEKNVNHAPAPAHAHDHAPAPAHAHAHAPAPAHAHAHAPAPKVIIPQPQLGSVWRPWSSSSLLVH